MVPAGAASALTLGPAACLTGTDEELFRLLPDVSSMTNEAIFQKGHRHGYEHAVRNCGASIVEVETVEELERAISERTAMLFFVMVSEKRGANR